MITDERMGDRVEVIMVLTGIGATPIEVPKVSARPVQQPEPVATIAPQPRPMPVLERAETSPSQEPATIQADLDIPAFLRRRIR